jgi:hypothetical protein
MALARLRADQISPTQGEEEDRRPRGLSSSAAA